MKYKSTYGQLRKYGHALRRWRSGFDKAVEDWIRREGEKGLGGKWNPSTRKYTVLSKPVLGPEPTPDKFGLIDEYVVSKCCPKMRAKALAKWPELLTPQPPTKEK